MGCTVWDAQYGSNKQVSIFCGNAIVFSYLRAMKNISLPFLLFFVFSVTSCNDKTVISPSDNAVKNADKEHSIVMPPKIADDRFALGLNAMQKHHQLVNMRDHLQAVQDIVFLLSDDEYDQAAEVAKTKLGSSTEMKLMCASFGNKEFENLGLSFHQSADEMSEVFKTRNKQKSLESLAVTMNYCVQCHASFRQ